MKKMFNNQKGFVIPLVIAIVAILAAGGAVYLSDHKKVEAPVVIDTNIPPQATTTSSKLQFKTQDEQTRARESAQGIYNYVSERGIMIQVDKQFPNPTVYKLPIAIRGYVSDLKKWHIFEGEAGSVQVYASIKNVEQVIASVPVVLNNFSYGKEPPFYFDLVVGDRQWISLVDKKEGYILFKEAGVKDGEIIDTIKIPIVFDIAKNSDSIDTDIPPPLGESTLRILCVSGQCNTSSVKSTRSDFYLTVDGTQVKVLIDIETRLRYVSGGDSDNPVETETLQKWADFYPMITSSKSPEYRGMPFSATIYGDWIDATTFKANWIKWSIG